LGTAGPQTFGDLYASFGYLGQILLTPMVAALLLSFRKLYKRNIAKSSMDRALWTFLIVSFGYLGYSDFGSFKAIGFGYLFLVYLVLHLMNCFSTQGGARRAAARRLVFRGEQA
jgi:hypothetical protein